MRGQAFLCVTCALILATGTEVEDDADLKNALTAFYHATNGPAWTNRFGWLTPLPICQKWAFVKCENGTQRVLLELENNNLVGSLELAISALKPIHNRLAKLNFMRNSLTGTIPTLRMSQLDALLLENNPVTGHIPSFDGTPRLYWLQLGSADRCALTGPLPSFKNLRRFHTIHAKNCRLEGSIDVFNNTRMRGWLLAGNKFDGTLPKMGLRTTAVDLSDNQLRGQLPEFEGMSLLHYFIAWGNRLTGNIPPLRNHKNLTIINLYDNKLDGALVVQNCPSLVEIQVQANKLSSIGALHNCPALKLLNLERNELTGRLPELQAPNLEGLYAGFNRFTGSLNTLRVNTKLKVLSLDNNPWTRAPMPSYDHLTQLNTLSLRFCGLNGTLPSFQSLTRLGSLLLSHNQLRGTVPKLLPPKLQTLDLARNRLSGSIPVLQSENLRWLSLDRNEQLSGTIPSFCGLKQLNYLSLLGLNQLQGSVPDLNCSRPLESLESFFISGNGLTRPFPKVPLRIRSLTMANSSLLQGSTEGFDWFRLPYLVTLDLSDNGLTGPFPTLAAPRLQTLNLARNAFSGSLFLNYTSPLVNLDIQMNAFSGLIRLEGRALRQVDLTGNHFSDMLLNRSPQLTLVRAGSNQLASVSVNYCDQLFLLDLHDNLLSGVLAYRDMNPSPPSLMVLSLLGNPYLGATLFPFCSPYEDAIDSLCVPRGLRPSQFTQRPEDNYACADLEDSEEPAELSLQLDARRYFEFANCRCNVNFAGQPPNCVRCPDNVFCPGDRNQLLTIARQGFWIDVDYQNLTDRLQHVQPCRPAVADAVCSPNFHLGAWTNGSAEPCANGYSGRICSKCEDNYFAFGPSCMPCGRESWHSAMVAGLGLALSAVFVAFSLLLKTTESGVLKILIMFTQVAAIAPYLGLAVSSASPLMSLLFLDIKLIGPECLIPSWTFAHQFWFIMSLPPLLMLLTLALYLVGLPWKEKFVEQPEEEEEPHQQHLLPSYSAIQSEHSSLLRSHGSRAWLSLSWRNRCVRALLFQWLFIYPTVCGSVFSTLSCSSFRNPDSDKLFFTSAPYMACDNTLRYASACFGVVYVLGFPAGLGYFMMSRNLARRNAAIVSFLTGCYQDKLWWYEAVILLRRLLVMASLTLFEFSKPELVMSVLLILLASLLVHRALLPFATDTDNALENTSLVLLLVTIALIPLRDASYIEAAEKRLLSTFLLTASAAWALVLLSVLLWRKRSLMRRCGCGKEHEPPS